MRLYCADKLGDKYYELYRIHYDYTNGTYTEVDAYPNAYSIVDRNYIQTSTRNYVTRRLMQQHKNCESYVIAYNGTKLLEELDNETMP